MVSAKLGFWVEKIKNIFREKTGVDLFCGTLNIKLSEIYEIRNNHITIFKEEYGGSEELYFERCNVLGHSSFIIRTKHNASGNRRSSVKFSRNSIRHKL